MSGWRAPREGGYRPAESVPEPTTPPRGSAGHSSGAPSPAAAGLPDEVERVVPAWVHAVTPAEIVRQRALKWPDFHPEDFCHRCGRRNPVWWVESEHWNRAVRNVDRGVVTILCPPCFTAAYERETGVRLIWELRVDPSSRALRAALAPVSHDADGGEWRA